MQLVYVLVLAGFKKAEISKQLNFNRITVHWVKQRFKASEFLKDRLRSGRPPVISQDTIKMVLENDPCQNMTRQTRKKISVSTVFRMVKKMRGKSQRHSRKPLLRVAVVQKRLERSTRLLIDLKNYEHRTTTFSDENILTVHLVF